MGYSFIAFSLLSITAQSAAFAEEPFRIKAGLSMGTYTSPCGQPNCPDLKADLNMLNVSGTYVFAESGMFVDLGLRTTVGNNKWNSGMVTGGFLPDAPVTRSETSITIGKMLQDGYHVFGGYQTNESKLTLDYAAIGFPPNDEWTLKLQGFFLGGGKAISIGSGYLSLTGTLSRMSGTITTALPPTFSNSWGAGTGYSLGAAYSYPITNMLSVVPEIKRQAFKPSGWTLADTMDTIGVSVTAKF